MGFLSGVSSDVPGLVLEPVEGLSTHRALVRSIFLFLIHDDGKGRV